jgi:hypothetical protein
MEMALRVIPVPAWSLSKRHATLTSAIGVLWGCSIMAIAQSTPAVTLIVSSDGASTIVVRQGALVTLTATVAVSGAPVSPGQVRFCEVRPAPRRCADVLLLGTVQLLSNGVATYKYHPGAGTHTFRAEFVGTRTIPPASSLPTNLIVTAYIPTTTAVTWTGGSPGDYTLTATVTGTGGVIPPTGTITFIDQTNQNYALATANLIPAPLAAGISFSQVNIPAVYFETLAQITTADVDGDGWPDILWGPGCGIETGPNTYLAGAEVDVLLGKGDGTFAAKPPLPVFAYCGNAIAIGDFNGDGIPDIAVPTIPQSNNLAYLRVYIGNGDGTFRPGQIFLAPGIATQSGVPVFSSSVLAGDFNGDGIPDLLVTRSGDTGVTAYFGNGDGTFTPGPSSYIGDKPFPQLIGDFNNDGIPDLVAYSSSPSGLVMNILLGKGDGTFNSPMQLNVATSYLAFAADFNGDGNLDLAVVSGNDTVVLIGNGDGTFQPARTISSNTPVAVADVNNDGYADIVAYGPPPTGSTSKISNFNVFLSNGDGTFQPPVTLSSGLAGPNRFAVADFNGDGQADIVAGTVSPQTTLYADVLLSQFNPQIATATVSNVFVLGSFNHTIEASYPGDTAYQPSAGTVSLSATQLPTTLTLTANHSLSAYGQQVVITASVAPSTAQNQIAGGTVTYTSNGSFIGSAPVSGGIATFNVNTLPVGTDTVIATYSGDANFIASSASITQVVSGYASSTSLTATPNPAGLGQPVTLSATVAGFGLTQPPTGTVAFFDGAIQLASTALDAAGHAAFTTSTLSLGSHSLTAVYSSDPVFHASTSAAVTETVILSDFSIAIPTATLSLQTYQHATIPVTLTSIGAFADTLTLTCGNLPRYITCILTPNPATLTADAAATVSLYLDTDSILGSGGSASIQPNPHMKGPFPASPINLALLVSPFSLLALLRSRRRTIPSLALLAILALPLALALTACGGSIVNPVPSAAPGIYTIPITATGNTTTISHTAQLTLTVTP